jgi:hypothetical protein
MGTPLHAHDATLRWSTASGAAGYKVYTRQDGQAFAAGTNVGKPPTAADGNIAYILRGLPDGVRNYFVVTAYDALNAESGFSNELSLLVSGPTATPTLPAGCSIVNGWLACTSSGTETPTRTPVTMTPGPSAVPTPMPQRIAGTVLHHPTNEPVPAVEILVQSSHGESAYAQTDGSGSFEILAGSDNWWLELHKDGGVNDAITSLDAAYVMQAVVGQRELTPIQRLACDVTGDGSISALDAALILQLSTGLIARFPVAERCSSDWAFPLPSIGVHDQSPNAGDDPCCSQIDSENLFEDAETLTVAAVLRGDCTESWLP